jgi:hypothetical protein
MLIVPFFYCIFTNRNIENAILFINIHDVLIYQTSHPLTGLLAHSQGRLLYWRLENQLDVVQTRPGKKFVHACDVCE